MLLNTEATTAAQMLAEIIQELETRRTAAANDMRRAKTKRDLRQAEAVHHAMDKLRDDLCGLGLSLHPPRNRTTDRSANA